MSNILNESVKADLLQGCERFDWDEHNSQKNWTKHQVSPFECEQIFFNQPLVLEEDRAHSGREPRFYGLGVTDGGRELFVVFTVREKSVRVISVRDMSRKERKVYRKYEKEAPLV